MKKVFVSVAHVLIAIALVATSTDVFAGPGSPAPPGNSIKFASASQVTLVAGPGSPRPLIPF